MAVNATHDYASSQIAGALVVPGTSRVLIAVRNQLECVIASGALLCRGYDGPVFGSTSGASLTSFTQIGTDTDWQSVSATSDFACGIKTDNSMWCWGSPSQGELGDGLFFTEDPVALPIP